MEKGLGLIWRHLTGTAASAVQQSTTAAYLQQYPFNDTGGVRGLTLTVQKGMPETSGTIVPFTYAGCKITDFELTCKVGDFASIDLTIDGMKGESTGLGYASPSYPTGNKIMHFGEGAVLLGGTPTTTAGVCAIAGGTAPTGFVSEVSIKGTRKMNTKRVNIGQNSKGEQLEQTSTTWPGRSPSSSPIWGITRTPSSPIPSRRCRSASPIRQPSRRCTTRSRSSSSRTPCSTTAPRRRPTWTWSRPSAASRLCTTGRIRRSRSTT